MKLKLLYSHNLQKNTFDRNAEESKRNIYELRVEDMKKRLLQIPKREMGEVNNWGSCCCNRTSPIAERTPLAARGVAGSITLPAFGRRRQSRSPIGFASKSRGGARLV